MMPGTAALCRMSEHSARLLLIDDDDDFASSLLTVLETSGHLVRRASDGTTGIQMAMTEPFDLVICDIRMPGIGGMEVLQQLHAA